MKTWFDRMSRIAGYMLFQGGYVTSPAVLGAAPPVDGARGERDVRDACRAPATVADAEKRRPRLAAGVSA